MPGTAEPSPEAPRATVLAELLTGRADRDMRRLPALVRSGFVLVRAAAPRTLRRITALQMVSAVIVLGRLLAAREVLVLFSEGTKPSRLLLPALVLLALSVVQAVLGTLAAEQQRLLEARVQRHMQGRVLDVAQRIDLTAYEDPDYYDRYQRAQYGALARPLQVTSGTVAVLAGGLSVVALLVALVVIAPVLAPLVIVGYLPVWIVTKRNSRSSYELQSQHTEEERRLSYLADVLSEREFAKELRANGVSGVVRDKYERLYDARLVRLRRLAIVRTRRALIAAGLAAVAASGALALVVHLVSTGRLSLADAAVATLVVLELGARLNAVYAGAGNVYEGALYLEDAQHFFDGSPPPASSGTRPARRAGGPPRVSVRDLGFSYPGSTQPALHDLNFELSSGEVVAVVGQNGSGKTTLAMLLAGLFSPQVGEVALDDEPLGTLDPAELRERVSVLFQDFARYQLTLNENIALGHPTRGEDPQAVATAAELAGLAPLLARLPSGGDSLLGRSFFGGLELSVGQWQRVALARAFLRDADLLILDEPTAALDPQAEQEAFEAVHRLAEGRTVVFVSHRFATVRSADRILVMDEGRLVEEGSHDQLMAARGLYFTMYDVQAAAFRFGD